MSIVPVPHLIMLRFRNKSPNINNALYIQDFLHNHQIEVSILDITEWPFIPFDNFNVQFVLKNAGIFYDFTEEEVISLSDAVALNSGVSLARRAYLSALRFVVQDAYLKGVHKAVSPQGDAALHQERKYFFTTDTIPFERIQEVFKLSQQSIEVSDMLKLPAVPCTYDLLKSFLSDIVERDFTDEELNSLAHHAFYEKSICDSKQVYLYNVAQAYLIEAKNYLDAKNNKSKEKGHRDNQKKRLISLTESAFNDLKEEMLVPAGFKKLSPREVGNMVIGDLKLVITLNKGSDSSLLNFSAFIPAQPDNLTTPFDSVDTFHLSLRYADLKHMDLADLENLVADEVARSKIPAILAYSMIDTDFWGKNKGTI